MAMPCDSKPYEVAHRDLEVTSAGSDAYDFCRDPGELGHLHGDGCEPWLDLGTMSRLHRKGNETRDATRTVSNTNSSSYNNKHSSCNDHNRPQQPQQQQQRRWRQQPRQQQQRQKPPPQQQRQATTTATAATRTATSLLLQLLQQLPSPQCFYVANSSRPLFLTKRRARRPRFYKYHDPRGHSCKVFHDLD